MNMNNKYKTKNLPKSIETIDDVKKFAYYLANSEKTLFHPDEDFNGYIDFETKQPCYTKEQAVERNNLMQQCFSVCDKLNVDIYDVMGKFLQD